MSAFLPLRVRGYERLPATEAERTSLPQAQTLVEEGHRGASAVARRARSGRELKGGHLDPVALFLLAFVLGSPMVNSERLSPLLTPRAETALDRRWCALPTPLPLAPTRSVGSHSCQVSPRAIIWHG